MKVLLSIVIVCGLVGVAPARQRKNRGAGALVDTGKPAVLLSFLRLKRIEPDDPTDDPNYLFFSLTNNSRWPIWLHMSGVSKEEYGEASLYYAVEDQKSGAVRVGSTRCSACSFNPLKPGESIVFSLPLRHAGRDRRMRVAYTFDWERGHESEGGSYSEHSVVFYFSRMPAPVLSMAAPPDGGTHPAARY